jgi:glycosyltransferase involved in cell wall biosynthesis
MRILHIVAGDLRGGAARGAYCLHKGLKKLGIESKILTTSKETLGDSDVVSLNSTKKEKVISLLRSRLDSLPTIIYKNRKKVIFSTSFWGYDFTKSEVYKWTDIIHLHWINAGMVNIRDLSKVDKPMVWTMRDMWPMTGGCHVAWAMGCDNYKNNCGYCKQLGSNNKYVLSYFVLKRKKKYLPKTMKIVGISNWLSKCAKESSLFRGFDVRTIHNNIDCEEFFPIDKIIAREVLGIKTQKKIILVGAQNLNTFYKGFDKFIETVNKLDKNKYYLSFFGKIDDSAVEKLGFEYKSFGVLNDFVSLRLLYSAADVFVASSLMESFGKTLAEAMACGTPVVCFDATGPKDIVDHQINGYKAKPFDTNDLSNGIEWVLESDERWQILSQNARQKVLENFEMTKVALKYKELYEEISQARR